MQQFGYQPPENMQCDYNLPLTPEQQAIFDQNKQIKKGNDMEMDRDDHSVHPHAVDPQCAQLPSSTMDIDGGSHSNPTAFATNQTDDDDIDLNTNSNVSAPAISIKRPQRVLRKDNK